MRCVVDGRWFLFTVCWHIPWHHSPDQSFRTRRHRDDHDTPAASCSRQAMYDFLADGARTIVCGLQPSTAEVATVVCQPVPALRVEREPPPRFGDGSRTVTHQGTALASITHVVPF